MAAVHCLPCCAVLCCAGGPTLSTGYVVYALAPAALPAQQQTTCAVLRCSMARLLCMRCLQQAHTCMLGLLQQLAGVTAAAAGAQRCLVLLWCPAVASMHTYVDLCHSCVARIACRLGSVLRVWHCLPGLLASGRGSEASIQVLCCCNGCMHLLLGVWCSQATATCTA